jgi:pimeloyl-ACP methyl ester carboxylesterase
LGIHRFNTSQDNPPVLALHGMIENGRIFFSSTGKGLAPFLARNGFDVFVADFRGRGISQPPIRTSHNFSQTSQIIEDIPTLIDHILAEKKGAAINVICHSWGGVLFMASFARFEQIREKTRSAVFFATKRTVRTWSLKRLIELELFWNRGFRVMTKTFGYLPAKLLRFGYDDETALTHWQCVQWLRENHWVDPVDHFDYTAAFQQIKPPPILSFAGSGDAYLGNPKDCVDFIQEIHAPVPESFIELSMENGNKQDYDHVQYSLIKMQFTTTSPKSLSG